MIIDTHCHAGKNWFLPIESLEFEMKKSKVDAALLVQHGGNYDNEYIINQSEKNPKKFKCVVLIDPDEKKPITKLEKLKEKKISGLRLFPNSVFSNLSNQNEIWSKSGEMNILISCQPYSSEESFYEKEFINIVENNPQTTIIIEHLGGICINGSLKSFNKFLDIAQYPNIYIKVPGLGEVLDRPKILKPEFSFQKNSEYFGRTLEAFGSDRMMWGSDYPPSAGREGYYNTILGITDNPIFSEMDVKNIMGLTAKKLLSL